MRTDICKKKFFNLRFTRDAHFNIAIVTVHKAISGEFRVPIRYLSTIIFSIV